MNSVLTPRLDRFVAFSFCWAQIVIELDDAHRVTFIESIAGNLPGDGTAPCIGRPIHDLVVEEDRSLLDNVLNAARAHGRVDGIDIRLRDRAGAPVPMTLAGHYLSGQFQSYYLAFHVVAAPGAADGAAAGGRSEDGLYEERAFAEAARRCFGTAQSATGDGMASDPKLTLLSVPGLAHADERLTESQRGAVRRAVASILRGYSADGDTAARFAEDRYGLVHEAAIDIDQIKRRLSGVLLSLDPSGGGGAIESATLGANPGLSEEDIATGLVYAINEFQKTTRTALTIENLGNNLGRLAKKGAGHVMGFRHIIRDSQFDIAFHPIIRIADGAVHHFEVLARFHGRHGESPYQYITFAEETGLIMDFDLAMTEKVIDWMARSEDPHIRLAVNVSGKSITSPQFGDDLRRLLGAHPWTRRRLMFEVTESFQIDDLSAANRLIQQLRGLGYAISLDDFGAGAASFKYLNMIDVDIVKFDGSAVRNSQAVAKGPAFLKALTKLCHEVGAACVAEMIDSRDCLNFVADCGIDFVQGYLFGKPSNDPASFAAPASADARPLRVAGLPEREHA